MPKQITTNSDFSSEISSISTLCSNLEKLGGDYADFITNLDVHGIKDIMASFSSSWDDAIAKKIKEGLLPFIEDGLVRINKDVFHGGFNQLIVVAKRIEEQLKVCETQQKNINAENKYLNLIEDAINKYRTNTSAYNLLDNLYSKVATNVGNMIKELGSMVTHCNDYYIELSRIEFEGNFGELSAIVTTKYGLTSESTINDAIEEAKKKAEEATAQKVDEQTAEETPAKVEETAEEIPAADETEDNAADENAAEETPATNEEADKKAAEEAAAQEAAEKEKRKNYVAKEHPTAAEVLEHPWAYDINIPLSDTYLVPKFLIFIPKEDFDVFGGNNELSKHAVSLKWNDNTYKWEGKFDRDAGFIDNVFLGFKGIFSRDVMTLSLNEFRDLQFYTVKESPRSELASGETTLIDAFPTDEMIEKKEFPNIKFTMGARIPHNHNDIRAEANSEFVYCEKWNLYINLDSPIVNRFASISTLDDLAAKDWSYEEVITRYECFSPEDIPEILVAVSTNVLDYVTIASD